MFDQYSSGTEDRIEGVRDKAEGLIKKAVGIATHNDELVSEGDVQRANGQALTDESQRDAERKSAY